MSGPEKQKPKPPKNPNEERERLIREAEELQARLGATEDVEEKRRAQALLREAERRLQTLEPKKKPGFGRLPEKPKEREYLDALTSKEKFELLRQVTESKPETPQQKFLLLKLSLIQQLATNLASKNRLEITELLGNFHISKRLREKYKERLRNPKILLPSEGQAFLAEELKKPKEWLEKNGLSLAGQIFTDKNFDLNTALPPDVKEILETYGTGQKLESLQDERQVYAYFARFIESLRRDKNYQETQDFMENLLTEEFKKGKKLLTEQEIGRIKSDVAKGKVFRLYLEQQGQWRKQGMTEEQIQEFYQTLLKVEEGREIKKAVAAKFLGKRIPIPESKRAIWDQYRDMLDPQSEWFNLQDETWDTITREVMINAPLIVVSGGVAALARKGLSQVTAKWLASQGSKWFGRKIAERTLLSRGITAVARTGAGILTEGTVFDLTHSALTGDIFKSLPEWGKSIIWSSITLGAFHGSGKLSERAFTKTRHGVLLQTKLGKFVETLSVQATGEANKAVYEAIKFLLLKGHVEAVTMLLVGALQHGAYEGSFEEFSKEIGDEILHAYISIGALRISGKLAEKIQQRIAQRKLEKATTTKNPLSTQPDETLTTAPAPSSSPALRRIYERARSKRHAKEKALERAEMEVPDSAIEGPLSEALLTKSGFREVILGQTSVSGIKRFLKFMAQERRGEFDFLNREFRNLPIELVRAIILGHGVDIIHVDGIPGRVYGGKTLGIGGLGIVKEGLFISEDGRTAHRVVIKKMYFQARIRRIYESQGAEPGRYQRDIVQNAAFEREVGSFLQRLARENPRYPRSLLRVVGVSDHVVVYEKVAFEKGKIVSLDGHVSSLTTPQIKQIIYDAVEALHFLHQEGILHSDFKPDNIMLRRGEHGEIHGVLVDPGAIVGTRPGQPSYIRTTRTFAGAAYFSDVPLYRQMTADNINLSADVYAVGRTILFLLGRLERSEHTRREDPTANALAALAEDCIKWRETGLTAQQILDRLRYIP